MFYRDKLAINLPEFPGITDNFTPTESLAVHEFIKNDWTEITVPVDECAVGMFMVDGALHHVGIYCHPDKIVHCQKNLGVVADTLRILRLRGIKSVKYYQHNGLRS
jgi:hypothetical protein